jgi:hypothetical protein
MDDTKNHNTDADETELSKDNGWRREMTAFAQ